MPASIVQPCTVGSELFASKKSGLLPAVSCVPEQNSQPTDAFLDCFLVVAAVLMTF